MTDFLENIFGGAHSGKVNNYTTTTNMILCLLGFIVIIMACNYWVICNYSSKMIANENLTQSNDQNTNGSNDEYFGTTVRSTIKRVSQYKEGDMSDALRQYYNTYNDNNRNNQSDNISSYQNYNSYQKSETPEKGVVKLIIYHMPGCGHCNVIMHKGNNGELSQFEQLVNFFKNDNSVRIYDYQLGRDKEAAKYNAFPVIKIVTSGGSDEYQGATDAVSMAKAIINKKNWSMSQSEYSTPEFNGSE
jgi:hypothetical protein